MRHLHEQHFLRVFSVESGCVTDLEFIFRGGLGVGGAVATLLEEGLSDFLPKENLDDDRGGVAGATVAGVATTAALCFLLHGKDRSFVTGATTGSSSTFLLHGKERAFVAGAATGTVSSSFLLQGKDRAFVAGVATGTGSSSFLLQGKENPFVAGATGFSSFFPHVKRDDASTSVPF